MDVASLVLGAQDLHSLILRDPPRATRVVLGHEACERLTHDQAHIQRQAGLRTYAATRAL
jgi:hypothetical protein